MNKKTILWIIVGIVLLLIILKSFNLISFGSNANSNSAGELEKYRSESIPEECRLPQNQNLESWKEHLGHHENTLYCLDYYK